VALLLSGQLVLLAAPAWASPQSDALAKARHFYNQRQYDQAILNGEKALTAPALADSARVVIGRSYLERFRQMADPADLDAGRDVLRQVQPAALAARDRADLLIGLGESLYLDNQFGAASEIFSSALGVSASRDVRDSVLDWWATSMEHAALQRPSDERDDVYYEIVARTQEQLGEDPSCGPASYWLAAAARGAGDFGLAWDAALAGWVRALLSPAGSAALRADLDNLVANGIIPERAAAEAAREVERQSAADRSASDRAGAERAAVYEKTRDRVTQDLTERWNAFKATWK
jgi:hypothetical protein